MTLNSLYVQFAVLSSLVAARRWRLNAWKKDGARMSMDKIEKQIHTPTRNGVSRCHYYSGVVYI